MINHLWIPLSSSASALCWNDLNHIFHGSAALNCLIFPSLSLFCHLCFASKSCESSIPCDSDQMTVWQQDRDPPVGSNPRADPHPGPLSAWGEDALSMALSKPSSQHAGRGQHQDSQEYFLGTFSLGAAELNSFLKLCPLGNTSNTLILHVKNKNNKGMIAQIL